jgi:hypothetical protein
MAAERSRGLHVALRSIEDFFPALLPGLAVWLTASGLVGAGGGAVLLRAVILHLRSVAEDWQATAVDVAEATPRAVRALSRKLSQSFIAHRGRWLTWRRLPHLIAGVAIVGGLRAHSALKASLELMKPPDEEIDEDLRERLWVAAQRRLVSRNPANGGRICGATAMRTRTSRSCTPCWAS